MQNCGSAANGGKVQTCNSCEQTACTCHGKSNEGGCSKSAPVLEWNTRRKWIYSLLSWGTGSSVWTWGGTSSLWGWQSTGTGCPGKLWILLLWRYSRPTWTRSCAACFGRRVGLDDPQRALPTPTILWFCDSMFSLAYEVFTASH